MSQHTKHNRNKRRKKIPSEPILPLEFPLSISQQHKQNKTTDRAKLQILHYLCTMHIDVGLTLKTSGSSTCTTYLLNRPRIRAT